MSWQWPYRSWQDSTNISGTRLLQSHSWLCMSIWVEEKALEWRSSSQITPYTLGHINHMTDTSHGDSIPVITLLLTADMGRSQRERIGNPLPSASVMSITYAWPYKLTTPTVAGSVLDAISTLKHRKCKGRGQSNAIGIWFMYSTVIFSLTQFKGHIFPFHILEILLWKWGPRAHLPS